MAKQGTTGFEEYGPRTLSPQEQAEALSNAQKQRLLKDALNANDPAKLKAAADALTDQVLEEMFKIQLPRR